MVKAHAPSALLLALAVATACGESDLRGTVAAVNLPERLDFGSPYVGDLPVQHLTVNAGGNGWMQLVAVSCAYAEIDIDFATAVHLAPGESLDIPIRWTPRAPGPLDTTLVVETNVAGAEHTTIAVTGDARAIPACDDGNPCTDDSFDRPTQRCLHVPRGSGLSPSPPCDDGSACTLDDRCIAGICRGIARTCDDQNPCTFDGCDPIRGCIFPIDTTSCDDGDPCTADLCDPIAGCTHPNATDGRSCGAFTCAEAHVCMAGTCQTLDMTVASEGVPCPNVDRCSEGGVCQAGQCVGGSQITGAPRVAATFETFGGESSYVATDGYRYLFADRDKLRLTVDVPSNSPDLGLRQTGSVDVMTVLPPVLWQAGQFVVVDPIGLVLIDASDETAPYVAWTEMTARAPTTGGPYSALARVNGGVVVATRREVFAANPSVLFIPIDTTAPYTGTPAFLGDASYSLIDLDGEGGEAAWLANNRLTWVHIDGLGNVDERAYVTFDFTGGAPVRVSLRGGRAAVLRGSGVTDVHAFVPWKRPDCVADPAAPCQPYFPLSAYGTLPLDIYGLDPRQLLSVPEPGDYRTCVSGSPPDCMAGTSCQYVWVGRTPICDPTVDADCFDSVRLCLPAPDILYAVPTAGESDIVLTEDMLYSAGSNGVFGQPIFESGFGAALFLVDPMPATRLDRGVDHLLASGPIALPLRQVAGGTAAFTRVTGPLHGDVVALIPDGGNVVVAGAVASGALDVAGRSLVDWHVTDRASSAQAPRLLRGPEGASTIQTTIAAPTYTNTTTPCDAMPLEIIDPSHNLTSQPLCEMDRYSLYGSIDVAGDHVWALVTYIMDSIPPAELHAWQLDGDGSLALNEILDPVELSMTGVRAADDGRHVALFGSWCWSTGCSGPSMWLSVYPSTPPTGSAAAPDLIFFYNMWPSPSARSVRERIGLEHPLLLAGEIDRIALHDLVNMADPTYPYQLIFADADPDAGLRIPWMEGGRAWIAWRQSGVAGAASPAGAPYRLSQVGYTSASLTKHGFVDLPAPALRILDIGDAAVVTTTAGIVIVEPACE